MYATLDQSLVDHRVLQLFSYLECVWYTHTLFIFHLNTGKRTSWVCVLGRLTVTQEVWLTQANMEFSGAGHASSHSGSHHYNVV